MYHLGSIRCEHGAALVISLLLLVVLFVVSSGTLTTSRIETQIANNDTKGKQVLLAAEYALAVGENTVHNNQPDDKPGATYTQITYNERYLGTRIVIQSIYAVRYH